VDDRDMKSVEFDKKWVHREEGKRGLGGKMEYRRG
jgi:hypothetical protein